MRVAVREILGFGGIPSDRTSATRWLFRNGVAVEREAGNGGLRDVVQFTDLPEPVRLAFQARLAERSGLAAGVQDDAAQLALMAKPMGVQKVAHERAAVLVFVQKRRKAKLKWPQIAALFEGAGFGEGPSKQTVERWFKRVENVDPINWPPALAPDWKPRSADAPMSEEAFAWFKDIVGLSGKNGSFYPLKWAYRDTAEQARKEGWLWPSYETVRRRFLALPAAERRTLMQGEKAAAFSLTQYQPRTTEQLLAMDQVELDGREFKVTTRFRDGTIGCPWVILIVDRASSKVVGYAVSNSENAEAVAEAITNVCEEHGIPVKLLTDNGRAINSRKITGGLRPRYRTVQQRAADWEVPGVMAIYGIELQNTAPGAPRGKLPESIFSALRHTDNAPEFHRTQRSGQTDTPNPSPEVVGIDVFEAVLAKRIRDFNAMASRVQQAQGGSRDAAFERLSEGRTVRHVSPLQRRSVKMTWHKRMVMPDGRVKFAGGLFGDATTQEAMLAHEGKYVLVGIDPTDYSAPAMVRGWEEAHLRGRVLIEKLPAYEACSVNSDEGRRRAITEKRRARAEVKQFAVVNPAQKVAERQAAALLNAVPPKEPAAPKVVQLDTRGPFSPVAPLHPMHNRTGDAVAVSDADNAAQAELLKSLLGIQGVSREASGGNR